MNSAGKRVGILAGESSGDILGAGLMSALKQADPSIIFEGIGGPLMQEQGLVSMCLMDRLSVMGLIEPLKRLPELLGIRKRVVQHFLQNPPDVFIGIDSPDFNLAIEKKLKDAGIKTVHYVSPSVWAWRQKRIHKIAAATNLVLTLFPFEQEIYQQHNIPVKFVGHPLADILPINNDTIAARRALGLAEHKPVLAILPGSRHGEMSRLAEPFLQTASLCQQDNPEWQFVLPCANPERKQEVQQLLESRFNNLHVKLTDGQSRQVMSAADVILIASGTATLEALLVKKPMVVCYRMASLSFAIISRMLKVEYFSLPNLLAGRMLVPELVQDEVTPDKLYLQVKAQLDSGRQAELATTFVEIHKQLQQDASRTAAQAVIGLINA